MLNDKSYKREQAETSNSLTEDLVEAQSKRSELQATLSVLQNEFDNLHVRSRTERKLLNDLVSEKSALTMKLRDRDEELRGKAKLLEVIRVTSSQITCSRR